MRINKEINKLFGPDESPTIQSFYIKQLLRFAWSGNMSSEALRALCWRVLLGILCGSDKSKWHITLKDQVTSYHELKMKIMPSLDKVEMDPLSALSSGGSQSLEWENYYKNIDLTNFVNCDLDRLFMTGIDEAYFQQKKRREMLLSIILIWSSQHPSISYRQGMHEILGVIIFIVEIEKQEWQKAKERNEIPPNHALRDSFSDKTVEAHTYHLFSRIMDELKPLYDPSAVSTGVESQPFVVQFCSKIQEHYLGLIDPSLCQHLEENFVQSQLYGLRWTRLLLGREFPATDAQLFRVWDYMFACCYEAEHFSPEDFLDDDMPPNIYSVLASVRIANFHQAQQKARKEKEAEKRRERAAFQDPLRAETDVDSESEGGEPFRPPPSNYVCTPLLGALGDFMLGMLMQIRDELMATDSTTIFTVLMHFPEQKSIMPIIQYADMIRRGVVFKEAHLGITTSGVSKTSVVALSGVRIDGSGQLTTGSGKVLTTQVPGDKNGVPLTTTGWPSKDQIMKSTRRMSEKFHVVKTAMETGFNGFVHNIGANTPNKKPTGPNNLKPTEDTVDILDPLSINEKSKETNTNQDDTPESPEDVTSPKEEKSEKKDSPEPEVPVKVLLTPVLDPLLGTPVETVSPFPPSQEAQSVKRVAAELVIGDENYFQPKVEQTPVREPNGKGTGYGGLEGLSYVPVTPVVVSTTARKPSYTTEAKRDRRSSTGVDLNVINSHPSAISGKADQGNAYQLIESTKMRNSDSAVDSLRDQAGSPTIPLHSQSLLGVVAMSSSLGNNNAVGDRMLDIADQLANPAYHQMPVALRTGRELELEAAMRRDTVRRLRALADVLAGLVTIAEYDSKFSANSDVSKLTRMPSASQQSSSKSNTSSSGDKIS